VVIERAVSLARWSPSRSVTLAALVGFLGILSTTLVPVVMAVWAGLATLRVLRAGRSGLAVHDAILFGAGAALAALLLAFGGGVFASVLDGARSPGVELGLRLDRWSWSAFATFDSRPGGVGLLGIGPLVAAGVAVALGYRNRLIVALAAAAGVLVLCWMAITYPAAPGDVDRLLGHARNLALVALALALAAGLRRVQARRWRFAAAGILLVGLVVWPTITVPIRRTTLAVWHGLEVKNAEASATALDDAVDNTTQQGRFRLPTMSDRLADYIRTDTAIDARVLATAPPYWNVFFATGRPNTAGFAELHHQRYYHEPGPEYADALRFLEPAALRRLGIDYIHAIDSWAGALPDRAQRWLANPVYFELLARDGTEVLYRVRPAFWQLDTAPDPRSFEALRSVPASTLVYVAPHNRWLPALQVSSVLAHARLSGSVVTRHLHLLRPEPWLVEQLGDRLPDLIVLPAGVEPWSWMFPPSARQPVWSNDSVALFAPTGTVAPIMTPPPAPRRTPVSVKVSRMQGDDGHVTFDVASVENAPARWTGQDWIAVKVDPGPLHVPTSFRDGGQRPPIVKWFSGVLEPGAATRIVTYTLDVAASTLAIRGEHGELALLASSEAELSAGTWILALRLRHEYRPHHWRDAGVIPVMRIGVFEDGSVSFEPFNDVVGESPAGP